MAGHSKWAKVKHKKAVTDARKSRVFSKLVRLLSAESKKAAGDVSAPGLRVAIEKARKENVPSDTIERAIQKGRTDTGAALERVLGEAFGPGGVAIVMELLTDNRNRTIAEIRHVLANHGGSLTAPGGAVWAFEKNEGGFFAKTPIRISSDAVATLSELIEVLEEHDDVQAVYTNATFTEN